MTTADTISHLSGGLGLWCFIGGGNWTTWSNEMFFDRYPDTSLEHQVQVRPYNAALTKNMRSLNPEGNIFV
jgi:hypothetical protein